MVGGVIAQPAPPSNWWVTVAPMTSPYQSIISGRRVVLRLTRSKVGLMTVTVAMAFPPREWFSVQVAGRGGGDDLGRLEDR